QNELVTKRPSDDVRGNSRRRAVRIAPAPISRACSPSPYLDRASGGTDPRTFCDPVRISIPPIRMCRTRPAILPRFFRSFIDLLRWSERADAGPGDAPCALWLLPAPLPLDFPFGVGIHDGVEPPRGSGAGNPDELEERRQNEGRKTHQLCHTVPVCQPVPDP